MNTLYSGLIAFGIGIIFYKYIAIYLMDKILSRYEDNTPMDAGFLSMCFGMFTIAVVIISYLCTQKGFIETFKFIIGL